MPLNLSRILSPCSIKKVRDLYCLDENPTAIILLLTILIHPLSFGMDLIRFQINYPVTFLLVLLSNIRSWASCTHQNFLTVSKLLYVMLLCHPWRFLSEIVTPNYDEGSLLASGDLYTSFPQRSARVSGFASIGNHVRIGPQSLIGCTGIATFQRDDGSISDIPHIGCVVVSNTVRVSSNVIVSRILSDTFIGENTVIARGHYWSQCIHRDNCFLGPNVILNGSAQSVPVSLSVLGP